MWSIINDSFDSFPQINKLIKIPLHVVWKCAISEIQRKIAWNTYEYCMKAKVGKRYKLVLLYANNKPTYAILLFLKCWLSICWQTGCEVVHELTIRDLCLTLKCDRPSFQKPCIQITAIKIFSNTSTTTTTTTTKRTTTA